MSEVDRAAMVVTNMGMFCSTSTLRLEVYTAGSMKMTKMPKSGTTYTMTSSAPSR